MRLKLAIATSVSSFPPFFFTGFPLLKLENTLKKPLGKVNEKINHVFLQIWVQILVTR